MEEKEQQFKDKTGDKKHFTTIPNMIVNGYSGIESGVYLYIKKRTGEEGQFFEPAETTATSLKISKPTYLKIRNKLEKDGMIKFVGWKKGKTHPIKVFEVVDIWGINMGIYKKKGKIKNLSQREKGKIKNFRKVKNTTTNKNPREEEPIKKEPIIGVVNNFLNEPTRTKPETQQDYKNLKKLNKLKTPLLKRFEMANPFKRTRAQEEAAGILRAGGKR